MSSLTFVHFNTRRPVEWNMKEIMQYYLGSIVHIEQKKFAFEYDKIMFEEKKKNIEEINELIKEYQLKLSFIPDRIIELKQKIDMKEHNYLPLIERYRSAKHIWYGTDEYDKLYAYHPYLEKCKDKYNKEVWNQWGNFADQLEHRYLVQNELIKNQMFHEIWRRIKEGQQLQEELLAPRVEQALRRYRATHG